MKPDFRHIGGTTPLPPPAPPPPSGAVGEVELGEYGGILGKEGSEGPGYT